jgi:hypothetical protein
MVIVVISARAVLHCIDHCLAAGSNLHHDSERAPSSVVSGSVERREIFQVRSAACE